MAQLVIKGHKLRGNEVIEILEMLGGGNLYGAMGNSENILYFIHNNVIEFLNNDDLNLSNFIIFTLEEFFEKFPYKVGDKVYNIIHNENQTITNLDWFENEVIYQTNNNEYVYVNYLQPYKEENMDRKYDVEEYLKVWKETEKGLEVIVNYRFELKEDNGKFYIIKKQPQYPKTYEECAQILLERASVRNDIGYKGDLLIALQRLLVCRDAYWKIAGEQMGLEKPWEPLNDEYSHVKYVIQTIENKITCLDTWCKTKNILEFPTAGMRDMFYENFKDLIELVKELL